MRQPKRIIVFIVIFTMFISLNSNSFAKSQLIFVKNQVAVGNSHMVMVKKDGTVWSWGSNSYGQLGNGNYNNQAKPVKVKGLANVVQVVSGATYCLALKKDGTVWAWGDNGDGQLGTLSCKKSNVPRQIAGLKDIIQISAGTYHCVALKKDGTVWTWGSGTWGQLGYYFDEINPNPKSIGYIFGKDPNRESNAHLAYNVKVKVNASYIATGNNFTIIKQKDGSVWKCGEIFDECSWIFDRINIEGNVKQILAKENYALALLDDGSVWEYGLTATYYGQEGCEFYQIDSLDKIKQISICSNSSYALREDGTVYSWGSNQYGCLGLGYEAYDPTKISSLSNIISISTNNCMCSALRSDGTIWSWGLSCIQSNSKKLKYNSKPIKVQITY